MPTDPRQVFERWNNAETLGFNAADFQRDLSRTADEIAVGKSGAYNIDTLNYPLELTSNPDLQHYVTFYINVRSKTKFKTDKFVDVDVSKSGTSLTENQKAVIGAGSAAAAAFSATKNLALNGASFAKIFKTLKSSGATPARTAGVLAAPFLAGGAAAATTLAFQKFSDTLKTDIPKRITDAIVLPVEGIPTVHYKMNYETVDFGLLGALAGGGSAVDSSVGGAVSEAAIAGLSGLANLPQKLSPILGASEGAGKQAVLSAAAVQTNPFREVFFKAIDFRSFVFNYTFLPKNEDEIQNVMNIINLFKFHMHPELSSNGIFYVYPSEFELVYYFRGRKNPYMHRISTCVLEDMQIAYGGDYFATFESGAPAEISIKLSFKELELLTKERIVQGY